jgi:hypothetical protein
MTVFQLNICTIMDVFYHWLIIVVLYGGETTNLNLEKLCKLQKRAARIILNVKVILHQFWVKKFVPWKFNLEYGGTFTKLVMHVSSRNMFPTTRNLQIRVHGFRLRHCCGDWLTFGCFVPMIADHSLVKKGLVRWLPIMTSWRKDKQSWMLR